MFSTSLKSWRLALVAALSTLAVGVLAVPLAQASPRVWWVATSGTAASPGTSCAAPDFVAADHTGIQAAITAASAGDEIRVCAGTYAIGTTLTVNKELTLVGSGPSLPVLDGQGTTQILKIPTGGFTVNVNGMSFHNGRAVVEGSNQGGAIYAHPDVTLSINDALFVNNRASEHGGAVVQIGAGDGSDTGSLQISNSTFYKNSGLDGGGVVTVGITANASTITNSTFVGNSATRQGGAVNGSFSNLQVYNSTFIDNIATQGGDTAWVTTLTGSLIAYTPAVTPNNMVCDSGSASNNVSTDSSCLDSGSAVTAASLQLGFLAPWGGPVPTFSIGSGSSAIGAVTSGCPSSDQRGISRSGATCDAGAFEFVANAPSLTESSTAPISIANGVTISAAPTFTWSGFNGSPTFRVATELSGPLPGVNVSTSTGQLSGTPTRTFSHASLVITASDANGAVASALLPVDNCVLSSSDGEYLISNTSDLDLFRLGVCGLGAAYAQTADITWNAAWDSQTAPNSRFTGSYDGRGHSITGLRIDGDQEAFVSFTNGATISNLVFEATVTDTTDNQLYGASGLIGWAIDTTIDGVHGSGSITIVGENGCHGGLVGEANDTTISASSFVGTIDAPNSSWNGGLVGCPYTAMIIERSFFDGQVTGADDVGGLVGWFGEVEVRNSFAIGSISATGSGIGGLLGGIDDEPQQAPRAVIENSFIGTSIQSTRDTAIIGALVGEGPSGSITSSFWEDGLAGVAGLDPIGLLRDQGGTQPSITATSATSMKNFDFFDTAGWAIVDGWEDPATSQNVWGICDGTTRPFLLWQHTSDPCVVAQQPSPQPNTPNPQPSTPSAPSTPTPPTTSPTTPGGSTNGPTVTPGGFATLIGGREVPANISWSGGSSLRGTIGQVRLALDFGTTTNNSSGLARLTTGSPLGVSLSGLKPGSTATATLFSTPTSLGDFVVDATGTLSTNITVPRSVEAGSHRLRMEMTAANGDVITFWLGVDVRSVPLQLPATGSTSDAMILVAVWLLTAGFGLSHVGRRTSRLRQLPTPTD